MNEIYNTAEIINDIWLERKTKMEELLKNLRNVVGAEYVLSESEELLVYECDGLPFHKHPPLAVVFPNSTEDVSEVVKVLNKYKVSFSPRGAGTGLSGGALAVNRGVVIELGRMKQILKIDVENRLAIVEVGLVNANLTRAVAKYGLHYAPDPSSQMSCTIGGNIAENAGGIHCLKYGVTTDHVISARVVLSDGNIVNLKLNDSGYDLLGVFVGSEGTFGMATEATLKLTFNPPSVKTILAEFSNIDKASHAVSAIISEGIIPAALEMIDGETIRAVEASIFAAGLSVDAEAALLIELDGLEAGLDDEAEKAEAICKKYGAGSLRRAKDEKERKKLWAARKSAIGALGRVTPDLMLQDAVVPRSRLPEVLAETYKAAARYNLKIANVFHAGDGNLHPIICFDSRLESNLESIREAGREIMQKCVSVGGTITGEHGVGLDKSEYLPLIFNDGDMDAMLRVRAAFDPTGLCNPGKIIPILKGCGEKRANVINNEYSKGTETESAIKNIVVSNKFNGKSDNKVVDVVDGDTHKNFASIVGVENIETYQAKTVQVLPSSIEETSECLRLAHKNGWLVTPSGSHTKHVGKQLNEREIIISTQRMNKIKSHEPADLVATVEAGCSFSTFNERLSGKGQWLPIDPSGYSTSSIGGIIAKGIGGPLSFGYGKTRSHVIGMRVVLADGQAIKAGGKVVKNVAGYDLCKLFTGSYGTLGLIVEATFKLKPLPEKDMTLAVLSNDLSALIKKGQKVIATPLLPVAVELLSSNAINDSFNQVGKYILFIRFMGREKTVNFQIGATSEIFKEEVFDIVESGIWKTVSELSSGENKKLIWRVNVLPSEIESVLKELSDSAIFQMGVGDGRLRVIEDFDKNEDEKCGKLKSLMQKTNGLVVEHASLEMEKLIGIHHEKGITALANRIKNQLDPANVFTSLR